MEARETGRFDWKLLDLDLSKRNNPYQNREPCDARGHGEGEGYLIIGEDEASRRDETPEGRPFVPLPSP